MKKIVFFGIVLFFLISSAFAISASSDSEFKYANDCKDYDFITIISESKQNIDFSYSDQEIARSGCCSWHGGVCDCIGGRVVCCDGTFSPSCTCNRNNNTEATDLKNYL